MEKMSAHFIGKLPAIVRSVKEGANPIDAHF